MLTPISKIIQYSLNILELSKQQQYHAANLPSELSEELIEIINETLIVKLSHCLIDYYCYISGLKWTGLSGKRKKINYEATEEQFKIESQNKQNEFQNRSKLLIQFIFSNSNLEIEKIYLNGLFQLLHLSDNSISTKIIQIIEKLIPLQGTNLLFCELIFKQLLNEYIIGCYSVQRFTEICNILTTMIFWYCLGIQPPTKTPDPIKQYNNINNVIDNILINDCKVDSIYYCYLLYYLEDEFEKYKKNLSVSTTEKQYKDLSKDFFSKLKIRIVKENNIKINNNVVDSSIKNLPEKLIIQKNNSDKNVNSPPSLTRLFDDL